MWPSYSSVSLPSNALLWIVKRGFLRKKDVRVVKGYNKVESGEKKKL